MFDFSVVENTVSLLPDEELTATEMFRVNGEEISRIEIYQYNSWVIAYVPCIDGSYGSLYMDEEFMNLYWGEDPCEAVLKHAGVFDKNKIKTFRR